MPVKTLLAIVGMTDAVSDINRAIELATAFGAHLSILAVGAMVQPVAADYPVATTWIEQRQEDIDALAEVRRTAEELCRKNDISFDADYLYDDRFIIQSNVGARAIYADAVFFGNGLRDEKGLRNAVVSGASFDAGTPVLMMPRSGTVTMPPKQVLLAWNSRAEAATAARQALEMLINAETVHIVLVDPVGTYFRNGGEPGADVAAYLARHGVKAVVEQLASAGRPAEEVLKRHALETGCDMIVMGAYGHSRLREHIFGGVTASILEDCPVPVFLAR